MNVSEIMSTDVQTCSADSDLESVAKIMWEKDCGSVPVMDNSGQLVGIITDRDIAMGCALNHKPEWELKASDILNDRQLVTCHSDADVRTVLETMSQEHIRRLPVVDGGGQLQGIVSIDDIISAIARKETPDLNPKDALRNMSEITTYH